MNILTLLAGATTRVVYSVPLDQSEIFVDAGS